jgi:hypothetical protein
MDSKRIQLGDNVYCVLTGFTGTAVSKTEWLYGCVRIGVLPKELKDGIPQDLVHFDEAQLEKITREKESSTDTDNSESVGGPNREGRSGDLSAHRPGERGR